MSDDLPVTRREFDLYKEFDKELRSAHERELARVDKNIELLEQGGAAGLEALRKDTEARFAAVATQRERDLTAQRAQREQDQRALAQASEHKREWSWQTRLVVAGLAIALAGLYVQAFTGR